MFSRPKISYILIVFTFVGVGRCEGSQNSKVVKSLNYDGIGNLLLGSGIGAGVIAIVLSILAIKTTGFAAGAAGNVYLSSICASINEMQHRWLMAQIAAYVSGAFIAVGLVLHLTDDYVKRKPLEAGFRIATLANKVSNDSQVFNNQMGNQEFIPNKDPNNAKQTIPLGKFIENVAKDLEKSDIHNKLDPIQTMFCLANLDVDFIEQVKEQQQKIQQTKPNTKPLRAPSTVEPKIVSPEDEQSIRDIVSQNKNPNLWTWENIDQVIQNLKKIYSKTKCEEYIDDEVKKWNTEGQQQIKKSLNEKNRKWNTTISLLQNTTAWTAELNLEDESKFKTPGSLSWFTSEVISIEAKRAVIRALLTKIRTDPKIQNKLTSQRYIELTGKVEGNTGFVGKIASKEYWNSWGTYISESFKNSKELENDTKQDGYLDQVITLFLLFVRDILEIGVDSVGGQTYTGSWTDYSTQDDLKRISFMGQVEQKKISLIPKTEPEKNVIFTLKEPGINFHLTKPKVYYLAELANAFYQFMSAEMDKSDGSLTSVQLADSKAKGSYIQRQEESNLDYLRKWFIRAMSVHPIISWLFENYKTYMDRKSDLQAGYVVSYCFWSDYLKYNGYDNTANLIMSLGSSSANVSQEDLAKMSDIVRNQKSN